MPASMVAPVLLHMARTDDVQRLTVRLDPAELGPVEIRVERAASGPARVELLAAHAGTLDLLRADGAALNRALDAAGVPAEGRQVSFSLGGGDAGGSGSSWTGSGSGGAHSGGAEAGQHGYARTSAQSLSPAAAASWQQFGVDFLA